MPRPIILGVVGDSAAGKTTITRGLVRILGEDQVTHVGLDDYHRYDRSQRSARGITPLHPDANYMDIMTQHLRHLRTGEPILKPVYRHADGTFGPPTYVEPHGFAVLEGLLGYHTDELCDLYDVRVFLAPPEDLRRKWKVDRDCSRRGYTTDQVLAELDKREPDSAEFIRPQRQWADIVVRFAPIEERGESNDDPLSATILLRPTAPHPDLSGILGDEHRHTMHLKMIRDVDGKPVDALHVHGYASRDTTRRIEESIWQELAKQQPDGDAELPTALGVVRDGTRSEPLAMVQLILLYHLLMAGQPDDGDAAPDIAGA